MWAARELHYALVPTSQLIAEVRNFVTGPLSARLRRDPEAVRAFEDTLEVTSDPVMKAAIPSALGIAGALTQRVADWCAAELERQYTGGGADLGFDVRAGIVRGVAITLTDVLQGSSN
jgi:hypothetical protein